MRKRIFNNFERVTATDLTLISNEVYKTVLDRLFYRLMDSSTEVILGTGLEVTRTSATAISVAAGEALIRRTTPPTDEPSYITCGIAAAAPLSVAAAHATLNRIDIVILTPTLTTPLTELRDVRTESEGLPTQVTLNKVTEYFGVVSVVTGTNAVSPSAPATPAGSIKLANISITPATGILNQAAIVETTPRRRAIGSSGGVSTLSDVLRLPNGSVSTPSYSFANGSSTGAYSPAGNDYGVSVQGTLRFFMGTAGTPVFSALTANRALVTGTGGSLVASSVTDTQIGYLGDVTGAIQAQLNLKAPLASPTFSGTVTAANIDSTTMTLGGFTATTITIGRAGATTNILGDLITIQTSNSAITDKLVTLNRGGAASTGNDVGIQVQEGGTDASPTITGYFKTANARASWDISAPASNGIFRLTPNNNGTTVTFESNAAVNQTIRFQNITGTSGVVGIVPVISSLVSGDIIYANSSTTFTNLAKGTAGQVLTMNPGATAPAWTTPDPGGLRSLDIATATGNTPLLDKRNYLVTPPGGGLTLTLPAGGSGKVIRVTDAQETFGTNPVTVNPATGEKIDNLDTNEGLVIDVSGAWVEFAWSAALSRWVISGSTALAGAASIVNGGQANGAPIVIGTNDNYDVTLKRNNINVINITQYNTVDIGVDGSALLSYWYGRLGVIMAAGGAQSAAAIYGYRKTSTATDYIGALYSDNGTANSLKWRVNADGSSVQTGTSTTSDIRAKKNIEKIKYGLSEIIQLDPMMFNWNHEGDEQRKSFSPASAQRLQEIMPEMVRDDGLVAVDSGGNSFVAKAIISEGISAALVNSIKELHAEIESLKAEIAVLKGGR